MPTIAIQDTFLESFSQLPKSEQKRTQEMIKKLREDSFYSSLNLERFKEAADPRVYSIRVNDTYRAIVVRPEKSDVMLLVWVDHHDEAYRWAKRKRFTINPDTGVIQMWSLEEADPESSRFEESFFIYGLFSHLTDKQIQALGVPEALVAEVRKIQSIQELEQKKDLLPSDAWEALQYLAHGEEYDEVVRFIEELRMEAQQLANQANEASAFEKAIKSIHSSRHIVVISDDEQLNEILTKPLEKWRIFLHPSQKVLVEKDYNGPVRVLGGAGTGKTVVALHRARRLVRKVLEPHEKILVTTYNSNLADYLQECLRTMCSDSELKQMDVIAIDQLVRKIIDHYVKIPIKKVMKEPMEAKELWLKACQLSHYPEEQLAFVVQEYEQIIQNYGIETWEEYAQVSRTGRGIRISNRERERIWKVVTLYREQMDKLGWYDIIDLLHIARKWLEQNPGQFVYRSAVVDEAQDFHMEAFKLLRALVPAQANDLFIVGDPHQRIYSRQVILHQCGINIRGQRSKRLRINYRTTEQIREQAMKRLQGFEFDDLDGGRLRGKDTSLIYGEPPERLHFATEQEEHQFVVTKIQELLQQGIKSYEIAVLARTNKMVEKLKNVLKKYQIPVVTLTSRFVQKENGVNCGTMHCSKGLEFRIVFIVGVNKDVIPPKYTLLEKDEEKKQALEKKERSLLYVASTRARDKLYVTSYGTPSPLWGLDG
ncbi:UvrD-helicase domain-containing protein [Thermoflavimicrobium dichotomicum]|uniref:DNA 3'-5' helicase n=1 Tax=Thermoflavimicrobium dichotomicum TaxID=46223 RepID=A0A1I3LFP6_9BACL|nr:UvrD-helicase domain-containing protein [Thermoflavimicrobium dichotomicum]SFI83527.1 Part of AAA domain-containing protein [Thermoflavimicrobium dichotomicum]